MSSAAGAIPGRGDAKRRGLHSIAWLAALTLLAMTSGRAAARTVLLTGDVAIDRVAGLSEGAPLQGWAMHEAHPGYFNAALMSLRDGRTMLVAFSLDEIPPGNRIVHAELILPFYTASGPEPRFYLWRMLADWGAGACYRYRKIVDGKTYDWHTPGARGVTTDRAARPTDIVRVVDLEQNAEIVINVTEDVEMWHSGAAENHGWTFSVEDPGVVVNLFPPVRGGYQEQWRLRITYEPQ